MAIHPGWMRTDMGGPDAPISSDEAAAGIIDVISKSNNVKNDSIFTDYNGKITN